jgi:hypothetical protein
MTLLGLPESHYEQDKHSYISFEFGAVYTEETRVHLFLGFTEDYNIRGDEWTYYMSHETTDKSCGAVFCTTDYSLYLREEARFKSMTGSTIFSAVEYRPVFEQMKNAEAYKEPMSDEVEEMSKKQQYLSNRSPRKKKYSQAQTKKFKDANDAAKADDRRMQEAYERRLVMEPLFAKEEQERAERRGKKEKA